MALELGLNSSPEDDEDTPANILDIPQRFWNWSRAYLRHIDEEYLKEFKEKIVERFDEANLDKILTQGPGISACSKKIREENGISRNGRLNNQTTKPSKRRIKHDNDIMETPARVNRRDTRNSRSKPNSPSKLYLAANILSSHQKEKEHKSKDKQVSFPANGVDISMNNSYEDCNGDAAQCNGIKVEKANGHLPNASYSPLSAIAEYDPEEVKKFGFELATYGVENGLISPTPSDFFSDSKEESASQSLLNGDLDDDDDPMDEVTREIRKKQKELRDLLHKNKPIINELYERAQAESKYYECCRALDEADEKLFELAAKYERVEGTLNADQRRECISALNTRDSLAQLFYAHHHRSLALQRLTSSANKK